MRGPRRTRELCEEAQILARAGTDVILTCELFAALDETLARSKSRLKPAEYELQRRQLIEMVRGGINELMAHAADPVPSATLDPQVRGLMMQLLHGQIETKLIYQERTARSPRKISPISSSNSRGSSTARRSRS